MNLLDLARPLHRGLAALRRRMRSLLLVLGVSRTAIFLTATLVSFFLADYFLRLPLWVRGCVLLTIVAGAVVVVWQRLLRPLADPVDDDRLAQRVEAAHPELQDRLRSSLAFARMGERDPDNEDSPELMRVVVQETVELTSGVDFPEVAKARSARRWATGAAALLVLTILSGLGHAGLVSIFVQRSLLLRDVAWPRRTTLVVVGMEPDVPRSVTRGRDVTIQVRAEGAVPDRVRFTYWEEGNERRSEHVELTPTPDEPSLFAITLPVYASYAFKVSGGDDDRDRIFRIEARTPPAILSISMACEYPAYLERENEVLRGGDQRVPQGTKVRLDVRTAMPVRRALLAVGAEEPRLLETEAPDRYGIDLVATKDLRYSIRLLGENGEENDPGVDTFVLRVARDQPPTIRIHTPSARTERLADGVVLISFSARDDHRIDGAELHLRVNDEKADRKVALGESGGDPIQLETVPGQPPDRVAGLVTLDLAKLLTADGKAVGKGDRIVYHFRVRDSGGHEQRTRSDHLVEIISEDDLSQTIQGRQQELREAVLRTLDPAIDASRLRAEINDVRDGEQGDAASRETSMRRLGGRAQAAQARVIDDLDSIARRVQSLLNLYVFNRLDDKSGADQILPYYERHLLEPEERGTVPFRSSLYRELWTAHNERAIRGGNAHVKLIEMADLSDRLAVDHGPRAYRALGQVVKAKTPRERDQAMQDAAAEQRTITEGLQRLRKLMRDWQSYESVVRFFKGLRDTEKGVVDELGREGK